MEERLANEPENKAPMAWWMQELCGWLGFALALAIVAAIVVILSPAITGIDHANFCAYLGRCR